jgi:hypothetical protein
MFSYPPSSLYGASVDPNTAILPNNELPKSTMTNYIQPSITDTTYPAWAASLPDDGSNSTLISGSGSHLGFVDAGLQHYKPYLGNYWSDEMFDPRHQSGSLA